MKRSELESKGFSGFVPVSRLSGTSLATVPPAAGVYAVLCGEDVKPVFLLTNCGGWFKGNDPTVGVVVLESRWVGGTQVLYVGKADNLRKRIQQLHRFSVGEPVGHWGGRYLWQVEGCSEFLVASQPTGVPFEAERVLLEEFKALFGCFPFANLQGPRRATSG